MDAFETLRQRGYVKQATHPDEVGAAFRGGRITFYVGFDATAPSLHVGNLLQIMLMARLQRAGHRAIAVIGGGTTRIGDPTGRTELRQMLDDERIAANSARIRAQLGHFLALDGEAGMLFDNAEWLLELRYIPFLRDIGRQFSVNKMLAAEAYKARLERGLSFLELNYQILQAYDFLVLHRRFGCTVQFGGDDQWGNILAGSDLIRRCDQALAFGVTTPLVTTASGAKMGKTAAGAVWLDRELLSPFDYYQFWINCDDRDVIRFLNLYTFLDDAEIGRLATLSGAELREAKQVLAREATALLHGPEAAAAARAAAEAMIAGAATDDMPTFVAAVGDPLFAILADAHLSPSRSAARRLVEGGGVKINNVKITDPEHILTASEVGSGGAVIRAGKKHAVRVALR